MDVNAFQIIGFLLEAYSVVARPRSNGQHVEACFVADESHLANHRGPAVDPGRDGRLHRYRGAFCALVQLRPAQHTQRRNQRSVPLIQRKAWLQVLASSTAIATQVQAETKGCTESIACRYVVIERGVIAKVTTVRLKTNKLN